MTATMSLVNTHQHLCLNKQKNKLTIDTKLRLILVISDVHLQIHEIIF